MFDRRARQNRRRFSLHEVYHLCTRFGRGHDLRELCAEFQIRESTFWIVWRRYGGWRWHELTQYREMCREYKRTARMRRGQPPIRRVTAGTVKSRGALVMQVYELQRENTRLREIIKAFTRSSLN